MDTEEEVQTTVRLPPGLHQKVAERVTKLRHTKQRTTINQVLVRGAELWLECEAGSRHEPGTGTPSPQKGAANPPIAITGSDTAELNLHRATLLTPHNQKLVAMLAKILGSGNENAIRAVTANLEVFSDYARIKGQAKAIKSKRAQESGT